MCRVIGKTKSHLPLPCPEEKQLSTQDQWVQFTVRRLGNSRSRRVTVEQFHFMKEYFSSDQLAWAKEGKQMYLCFKFERIIFLRKKNNTG